MVENNGNNYDLKFNMNRVELFEKNSHFNLMASLSATGGMISLAQLENLFAAGLKSVDSGLYVTTNTGVKICRNYIEQNGYADTCMMVLNALQEGCPYLFKVNE